MEALLVLTVPELESHLVTQHGGGRLLSGVTREGYHFVEIRDPTGQVVVAGTGLDPRLALLDAIGKGLQLPPPAPNWDPAVRKDPRSYLNSVAIRSNVPDPADLDPTVLKEMFSK